MENFDNLFFTLPSSNMRRIIFLICLVSTSFLLGQTPGFLGMRNYLSGNIYAFPSLLDKNSTINLTLSLELHRVWTRNFSTGIYVNNYTTQFGYVSPLTQRVGRGKIEGWGTGLKVRWHYFFSRGVIAPLGPFQELEIGYLYYNIFDKDGRYFTKPEENPNRYAGYHQHLMLGLGIGEQRVIYKYILLQYGVFGRYVFKNRPNPRLEPTLSALSDARIRHFQTLSINVGLGWLLF